MLDPKLVKQLRKASLAEDNRTLSDRFTAEVVRRINNDENCLVLTCPGINKHRMIFSILNGVLSKGLIWYISPENTLSMYRLQQMRFALDQRIVSILSCSQQNKGTKSGIMVGAVELLAEEFPGWKETPDVVVIDDAEYLEISKSGTAIQECLAMLPQQSLIVVIGSLWANAVKLADSLGKIRGNPFSTISADCSKTTLTAAFLTSDWQLIPLIDNKRVANRVKKLIKETEPFKSYRSGNFINRLITLLREAELIPALILFDKPNYCKTALEECRKSEKKIGHVLTEPRIVSLLERNPELKDDDYLNGFLAKRAAVFLHDQHPLYQETVEHLLALNGIDIVFSTAEDCSNMNSTFNSAVIIHSGGNPENQISVLAMNRIKQSMEDTGSVRLIILVHTPEPEPAYIKDLLISPPGHLCPSFTCTPGSMLRLLYADHSAELYEEQCLAFLMRENWGEFCMEALQHGLNKELENARCRVNIKTIIRLIDLRLKLVKDIHRLEYEVSEARSALERRKRIEKLTESRYVLSLIPCESCPHHNICHKRSSKKFRTILNAYEKSLNNINKSKSGLRLDMLIIIECLTELGMIDESLRLTKYGHLALITGLEYPQFLTQALKSGLIQSTAQDDINFALIGGFLDPFIPEKQPFPKEFVEAETMMGSLSQNLYSSMNQVRERLFLFGLNCQGFYLNNAIFALECRKTTTPDIISQKFGVSPSQYLNFISHIHSITERLKSQSYLKALL